MSIIKYLSILGGQNWDIPLHTFTANEWVNLKNMRTWVRSIDKVGGYGSEFNYTMGISQPNMNQFWLSNNSAGVQQGYFVYAKAGNIRRISPAGDTDIRQGGANYTNIITPASPTIPDATEWNFTTMSGGYNVIVANPLIKPQYMNGDATQLSDLPNWGSEAIVPNAVASTCQVIRSFKNQLIAGNLTYRLNNGTIVQRPSTVIISDKAAPGGIPQTWLSTASNAADNFELNTTDAIQDIIVFRDYAVICTLSTTWLIGESTSQTATPVKQISTTRGLLGKECIQVVDGRIYMVTGDDIIFSDGTATGFKSISNDIVKSTFFESELNINSGASVFMRYHRYFNELAIFYPSKASGGTACDRALIYSLDDGSWSWTEAPGIYDATIAPAVGAGAADPYRPWTQNTYNFNVSRLHFAIANQLNAFDIGWTRSGAYETIAERFIDLNEVQEASPAIVKIVKTIYPVLIGQGQAILEIKTFQTAVPRPIDWSSPDMTMNFDLPDQTYPDYKVDPSLRGRYIAIRIRSNTTTPFSICSLALDTESSGKAG